jgi:pimeloyl-ACP methyl ester carboxylesterase
VSNDLQQSRLRDGLVAHQLRTTGATIAYWHRTGSDPEKWVLFIHGAGVDHRMFDEQLSIFDNSFNLLLPDIRGHGRSVLDDGQKALFQDTIEDMDRLLGHHAANNVIVVAQSFGAAVAQELAYLHPERVARLVLIGAFDHHRALKKATLDNLRIQLTRLILRLVPWQTLARIFGKASSRHGPTASYIQDALLATGLETWESLGVSAFSSMHEVEHYPREQPTLIIRGELDSPSTFPRIHEAMLKRNHMAKLVVIPQGGHSCNQDRPIETNRAISSFLFEA